MSFFDSIFGGSENKSSSSSQIWADQVPYLQSVMQSAAEWATKNNQGYQGDVVAGPTDKQTAIADLINQYATQSAGGFNAFGEAGLAAGAGGFNTLSGIAADGGDLTGKTMGAVGQYMNNDILNNQIDAVINDSNRALGKDVAGLNVAASGTGNMNSSRTGAMEANLRSDAANRVAGISAGLRGDAYNKALSLAGQQAGQTVGNQLQAGTGLINGGATAGSVAGQGQSQLTGALNAGQTYQQQAQAGLENDFFKNFKSQQDVLQFYKNMIGNPTVLNKSSSSGDSTPGIMSIF